MASLRHYPKPQRSRYYVEMAQRLRLAQVILLLAASTLFYGCKKPKSNTVVVHVLRNLGSVYGSELDRRILDFQGSNPRVQSGEHILIESETGDYQSMLQKQTANSDDVDLIILDSPDDAKANSALQGALGHAANVCAGLRACPANIPAIVPPQITGSPRDGAEQFQSFLQKTP
jgi:hypothetical protein